VRRVYLAANLAALILLVLVVFQVRDQQGQIQREAETRAYKLCIVSNQARTSLRDLLMFAERRVQQTAAKTGTSPEQVAEAVAFYEEALARVKIIECPKP
jgi:hypothetical protein